MFLKSFENKYQSLTGCSFSAETSSAYGNGAPGLSDRYVASFLWLDKLGMAALMNMKVVIRQSLFHGHYALIDSDLTPLPVRIKNFKSILCKNL